MTWTNFFSDIVTRYNDYPNLKTKNTNLVKENKALITKINTLKVEKIKADEDYTNKISLLTEQLGLAEAKNKELTLFKENQGKTAIDFWCEKKGYKLTKKAYQKKRSIKDKYFSMFLHELITPDSYEVMRYKRDNKLTTFKLGAKKLSKDAAWTDDKNLDKYTGDVYLYANEVLTLLKDDCEGHATVMTSMFPEELGLAWGMVNIPGGNSFGHSFNVYLKDDELWLLDTVENSPIYKKVSEHYYDVYMITTRKGTYILKDDLEFGMVAR